MKIAVLRDRRAHEKRVAASAETVKKFVGLGAEVAVEAGAGEGSRIADKIFADAGATIAPDAAAAISGADVILSVQRPDVSALAGVKPGAVALRRMAIATSFRRWPNPARP